jgi:NAD(P)H-quinone oxidoreductase subunit 5
MDPTMAGQERTATVGQLPTPETGDARIPAVLTKVVWTLWVASLGALAVHLQGGEGWEFAGLVRVDGLTVVMWATITFISGVVHSYSRRFMAGNRTRDRFFGRVFAFTLVVMVLVAAEGLVVFGLAWLAMGVVMAGLIGHVDGWSQARAAASLGRRYFLASSALLAAAFVTLWVHTGATTVSGVASAAVGPSPVVLFATGMLLVAAMVQSALVPFHTWLLSSMTAPTPASALMHAGFVNAGGVVLVRFAPVVTVEPGVALAVALVGATSALLGKFMKSVQTDVKTRLGCSTTGQMGFMIMQAGLGFFGAAIAHLVLHGLYKAYLFLSAGEEIERTSPGTTRHAGGVGPLGLAVTALTALAGGVLFAGLTGKGTALDGGLLLTGLVVLTTMHATRHALGRRSLPATDRYGAVPLVFLPAIAVYAVVYLGVVSAMEGLPVVTAPTGLTVVHGVVAAGFLAAYAAVETGVYRNNTRLYVALVNATRAPPGTSLTATEDDDEY